MSEDREALAKPSAEDIQEDVALFQILRQRLLVRLDAHEEDLRSQLEKARDAKRDVSGRGRRGTAAEPGAGTHGDRVLAWLRANPGRHPIAEIANAARLDRASVSQVLVTLLGAQLIARPARGLYEVPGPCLLPAHDVTGTPGGSTDRSAPPDGPPRRETPADRMRRMRNARESR
jgi:hypothetical protein